MPRHLGQRAATELRRYAPTFDVRALQLSAGKGGGSVMERNPYRPPQAPVADTTAQTSRGVVVLATVLLGIVPATVQLLGAGMSYGSLVWAVPDGIVVGIDWGEVFVVAAGFIVGYVALFFAAKAPVTRVIGVALCVGVVAMVFGIVSGVVSYWSVSPALVALAHAVGYFVGRRNREATNNRGAA